jgi:AcrR family transcriptional regulator
MDATEQLDGAEVAQEGADVSWRDRAVERSLRTARAKAVSRSDRFIKTAVEILGETGRTDFTVQELVERSKTSLRSFYQHFSSKDELMLALFEEIITVSTDQWRAEVDELEDEIAGLRLLLDKIYGRTGNDVGAGINRALSLYHLQLAESRSLEYARVLFPIREVIFELIETGVKNGRLRKDVPAETLAVITLQTLVGAGQMSALGAEFTGGHLASEDLWRFVLGGLTGLPSEVPRPTGVKRALRAR